MKLALFSLGAACAASAFNIPQRLGSQQGYGATASSIVRGAGYVPDGLTEEQWEAIKASERRLRNDLGKCGTNKFKSRSMRSFIADGTPHLFPADPKAVQRGDIDVADVPYMQRKAGAWDNSDLEGQVPGVQRRKWLPYDKQYAAWAEKAAQTVNLYGTGIDQNMPWTGSLRAVQQPAAPAVSPMAGRGARPKVAQKAATATARTRTAAKPQRIVPKRQLPVQGHPLIAKEQNIGTFSRTKFLLSVGVTVPALIAAALNVRFGDAAARKAPQFTLPGTDGQQHTLASLSSASSSASAASTTAQSQQLLVLFFFPGAQRSPTHVLCSQEVRSFERDAAQYAALGARAVGISADSVQRLQADFGTGLKHTLLLSDAGARIAGAFGTRNAGGTYADRATYVIRPSDGAILHAFTDVESSVAQHSEQVLAYLKQLQ